MRPYIDRPELPTLFVIPDGSLCIGDEQGRIMWVHGVKRGPRQEPGNCFLHYKLSQKFPGW